MTTDALSEPRQRLLRQFRAGIGNHHFNAGDRKTLGNAHAHRARADDGSALWQIA